MAKHYICNKFNLHSQNKNTCEVFETKEALNKALASDLEHAEIWELDTEDFSTVKLDLIPIKKSVEQEVAVGSKVE